MEDLFRKIYDTIICYEEDTVKKGRDIDREIGEFVQTLQDILTENQQEDLRDLLAGVSMSAGREGFLLGIKYTLKTLAVLLSS